MAFSPLPISVTVVRSYAALRMTGFAQDDRNDLAVILDSGVTVIPGSDRRYPALSPVRRCHTKTVFASPEGISKKLLIQLFGWLEDHG